MARYAVLLPGDEARWESASLEERQEEYGVHHQFMRLLQERGHQLVGGAELTHSRSALTVRQQPDGAVSVTEGPFAETVEQLTGFYLVDSEDLPDLAQACALLARNGAVEIRACVRDSDPDGPTGGRG